VLASIIPNAITGGQLLVLQVKVTAALLTAVPRLGALKVVACLLYPLPVISVPAELSDGATLYKLA
jgi:hypothetical protein